ncbi:3-methyl-2-oxobutanoate hydroxymethyltransferase [Desulfamplus magnetovallimortis]|uniref:3-methyl-2-oxobutanoate hydroxymethyltransferase n=1 Tax=Desulfamplus magnetovallimortis TaxID=1246637 RepID=A0A1W1HKN1_9BACT|nr:3-methyl-2-oxobutanoate hydroxymethyltransferase [Desulfamplus magnetovallimortis]SLM33013.1 3-methyl-2-oxobutanoate hydroxymethyltransferase [Desulfamplus magnetovallimortis]
MKHTVKTIQKMRNENQPITMLTAYDFPTAKKINDAGIDMILVGDSCAMVVHGHPDTLTATMDMMLLHCGTVARACDRTMVVADMPFGSFQYGVEETMRNAARFVTEARVDAVKFEATHNHIAKTKAIVEMGIAVVGHVGLHPQAVGALGGLKVQGKDMDSARKVVSEALALQEAGVFAIIFEAVPAKLSAYVTKKLDIPTISIGGGPGCSGQLLVTPDVLGLYDNFTPSFAKQYQKFGAIMLDTFKQYKEEVISGEFPGEAHSYKMSDEVLEAIEKEFG